MRNVYEEMAPIFIKHAHLNKTKTFYFQLSMSDFGVGRTHLEIEKLCMNMIRGQDESFRSPGPVLAASWVFGRCSRQIFMTTIPLFENVV